MSIGTFDQYELVQFSRNGHCPTRWNVTVFRTLNGVPADVVDALTIDDEENFIADHLWCDTGPGQEFLWGDYPSGFQIVLRRYATVQCGKTMAGAGPGFVDSLT